MKWLNPEINRANSANTHVDPGSQRDGYQVSTYSTTGMLITREFLRP